MLRFPRTEPTFAQQQQKLIAAGARNLSVERVIDSSRSDTCLSSVSPAPWPSESLMILKRSRSNTQTANGLPLADGVLQAFDEQHAIRDSRQGIVRCLALQFEIDMRKRLVALLEHVNRIAQLLAPVVQPQPQCAAEHAEQHAAAQGRDEAQPNETPHRGRVLRDR